MKRGVGEALRTRLDERDAADGALGLTRILGARYVRFSLTTTLKRWAVWPAFFFP